MQQKIVKQNSLRKTAAKRAKNSKTEKYLNMCK
jgi:hypothetical protein